MIVHFTDNLSTTSEFKSEMTSLLKDIRLISEKIGNFYMKELGKKPEKSNIGTDLFRLISVLCNHSDEYSDTILNKKDYTLPFALFVPRDNNWYWEFRMNDSINSCAKKNMDDTVFFKTKNYILKGWDESDFYSEITSVEWLDKAELHIKALIVLDMKKYLKVLSYTEKFYHMLSLLNNGDIKNEISNDKVNEFVNILQDNPEVLKLITIIGNEKFQKMIIPILFKLKIEFKEKEPEELFEKLWKQMTIWQDEQNKEPIKHLASVRNDLLISEKERVEQNYFSALNSLILSVKLEGSLAENEVQKRPKI